VAMTKRHRGHEKQSASGRIFLADFVSPPRATRLRTGWKRRARLWRACVKPTLHTASPTLKIGYRFVGLKIMPSWRKACAKPACRSDPLPSRVRLSPEREAEKAGGHAGGHRNGRMARDVERARVRDHLERPRYIFLTAGIGRREQRGLERQRG